MRAPSGTSPRTHAPEPGPISEFRFPPVVSDVLKTGLRVCLVRCPHRVVSAMIVIRAGETAVRKGQGGLALLTGYALEGGTTHRSSRQLAGALEGLGASFGAATGWDATTVAVFCQATHVGEAASLLAEMVRSPSFEDSEFERYRHQRLATTAQRAMDPDAMAADAHARFVYSGDSTYARPLGGSAESLNSLSATDAHAFVDTRYGPEEATLLLVGDVPKSRALEIAGDCLGDWLRSTAGSPEPIAVARDNTQVVHVVHRDGAVQSQLRVGHVGVRRSVPDYLALAVLNLILGGSFSSRLNLSLRERHGFTYGVRSMFAARRGAGPFAVATSVATDVTGVATREIIHEIQGLVESGPTGDEVDTAKTFMAGVLPLRLESAGQIASRIAQLIVHDLPLDYYQRYRDLVGAVTKEQVARAALRHLRPDELCTVIVGDAGSVVPQLEGEGLGPVVVHGEGDAP